jgi:hypothetical protein
MTCSLFICLAVRGTSYLVAVVYILTSSCALEWSVSTILIMLQGTMWRAVWQLHEDVAVACMACSELDVALGCLKALQAQFPSSMRVKNLHGLMLEAKGELDSAAELYDSIVAEQPANTTARRRQVCPRFAAKMQS